MSKIYDLTKNPQSLLVAKKIKGLISELDDDEARRVLSGLLSDLIICLYAKIDRKFSSKVSRKFLKGHLKEGWGWFDFMDHPGKVIVEGEEMATFEPYGIGLHGLKELIKYAEENNFYVTISAESPYYPGSTILITFKDAKSELAPFAP